MKNAKAGDVSKERNFVRLCAAGGGLEVELEDFIRELQDLRYLDWTERKMSPGTPGGFLKAYEEKNAKRYYYKLSNYDSYRGVFGHECINELIAARLLSILEIEHLEYQLVHAKLLIGETEIESYICKSENFRKGTERKIAFDTYYELHREGRESPLEFAKRKGWEKYVYQMFIVDYLICNRDRHGANIEILIDDNENARPAPLFDNGLSLLFSCYDSQESIREYDVLADKAVNNFIGARSLEYNLQFIPDGMHVLDGMLRKQDKKMLLSGLEGILSEIHLEKIWEMIWRRWERYAQICH